MEGSPAGPSLTAREREVAELVADGLTNGEIATRLGISERTVDGSVQQVYRKVGTFTRGQLATWLAGQAAAREANPGGAGGLPVPPSSFVGREEDVAQVADLLAVSRLVTLTGTGGVGKTRLAIQVARAVARRHDGDVRFVALSGVAEGDLVDDAVLAGLGLRPRGDRRARDVVAAHLGSARPLLVLDNCEHVIEASAALVDDLLGACDGLTVLATSREPLMLGDEQVRQVQPLGLPAAGEALAEDALVRFAALRLFAERARKAGAAFPVGPGQVEVIAQICQRLDGLPLAVELAAARTRVMSPAALLDHLRDHERFHVLVGGYRTADERHRTLLAMVEWSHRLLTDRERSLFARLSVFAGAFDLAAAQAVGSLPPIEPDDVFALLAGLVDKSLVAVAFGPDGQSRFRLLDTLRAFGRERLQEAGEGPEAGRRHAEHYAEVLARPTLTWTRAALDEMRDQLDDVHAALTWSLTNEPNLTTLICGRLVGFWGRQGPLGEGLQWMERIIERLPHDDSHKAIAFANGSWLAQRGGRFEVANRYALEELRVARLIADRSAVADALTRLGDVARNAGRLEDAVRAAAEGVAMRRCEDDRYELALALMVSGSARGRCGEFDAGRLELAEALGLFEAIHERTGVALCQGWLGELELRSGEPRRAAECLAAALRAYRELPDAWMVANVFDLMSWLAGLENEPLRALRLSASAASLRDEIGASRMPALAAQLERVEREARGWLRARAGETWSQGAAAGPEATIAYALRETEWGTGEAPRQTAGRGGLTPRERQVAPLVAQGLADKEIAARLGIGVRTAEHHVEQIRRKLGASSRAQVAAWMVEHELRPEAPPDGGRGSR